MTHGDFPAVHQPNGQPANPNLTDPMHPILTTMLGAASVTACAAAGLQEAAVSINHFGADLHRRLAAEGGNLVTSPWSIQTAMAMTYAGASGETKAQMANVLKFPDDEAALHAGMAAITADLQEIARRSREQLNDPDRRGGPNTAIEINAANRLFGQDGYPFEKPFLETLRRTYAAPIESMDFIKAPEDSRVLINRWVEEQTRERIKDLIPPKLITDETRLVLANAVFMKAPWATEFREEPEAPFFVDGKDEVKVPGLRQKATYGHLKLPGGSVVAVPYSGGGLQFLLLVPDERDGLAAMEKSLTAEYFAEAAKAPTREIRLHFPKFKLEPERVLLSEALIGMGMPLAFDKPTGSADFSRMAPRKPDDYLCISEVVHKAFIAVDQYGTEAAAATAVAMIRATSMPVQPTEPLEIRVDRPFAFAIQHIGSGACLFLGRVTDPR